MRIIYRNKVVLFLLIIAFFKPISFQYYSDLQQIDNLYNYFKIFVAIMVIVQRILDSFPKIHFNKPFFLIFCLGLWGVLTTVINQGYVGRAIIDFGTIYAIYVFISHAMKINSKKFIEALSGTMFFLVIIQLVSELIYPSGLPADLYVNNSNNPLYFVTLDNGTASLTILAVATIYLRRKYCSVKTPNIMTASAVFVCLLTASMSGSTTAMLCTVLAAFVPAFIKLLSKHSKFDKPTTWIIAYFFVFLLVIQTRENSIVNNIISTVTGKSGFTGRTFLWTRALNMISDSPFIGYGRQVENYIEVWGGYFSSHNVVLEALLQGGIIQLLLWIACIVVSAKKLQLCNDRYLVRLLLTMMFIILVALMMEITVFSPYLFTILALMNSSQFIERANHLNGVHKGNRFPT